MGKFLISILSVIFISNTCFAEALVLSDVIKEAREAQMKKELLQNNKAMKPVKNDCVSQSNSMDTYNQIKNQTAKLQNEQTAEEKLNINEIKSN